MDQIEFYNAYKDVKITPKPLPDYSLEDKVKWIFSGHGYHWVEFDFTMPNWLSESAYADAYYVTHRDVFSGEGSHYGWSSCALHGIDTDKTNVWQTYGYESEPDYQWTELGNKTKNIQSFFNNTFPAERYARIRFMKLAAGGWISPHNDYSPMINIDNLFDYPLPVNIAIDHPNDCHMTIKDNGCVPFKSHSAFMVNIFNDHSVINNSSKDRIHLIAHCYLGNKRKEFCELIVNSYEKQHAKIQSQV